MTHSFDHTVFPDSGMRILSATIHLLGSSIITYCLARCINLARVRSLSDLKSISWARWCVILVLLDSWLFVVSAGILIHGVGMSTTINACSAGIFLCIWLYDISKLLIYCFLIEKVRAVWGGSQPRLKSPVYLTCLFVMLPFFAIPIIMIVGRIAYFRTDGSCVIGLKPFSSISLLAYDLSINIFLNGMFLWPLLRIKFTSPRMRAVARRTLWAAGAALITSIVNITVLTVLRDELGWVCLGSCGTDVTLNAIVLFWVTSPSGNTTPPQTIRVPAQQSAPSHSKPGVEPPLPTPATASSHVVFIMPADHVPRPSMHSPSVSSKALEAARQEMALEQPSSSSTSFPRSPMEAQSNPSMEQHARVSPGRNHSWRRLFGLPDPQKEKDVEVHISVVTQHEIELGSMEASEKKQEDSESIQKVDPPNEW